MNVAAKCDDRRQLGKEDHIVEPAQGRRHAQGCRAGNITRRGLYTEEDGQQSLRCSTLGEEARW